MRFRDLTKSSFTSLRRNKVRTFLTSFAIFIGVFVIVFLISLSNGAQKIILSQITDNFDVSGIIVLKKDSLSFNFFNPQAEASEDDSEEVKLLDNETIEDIETIDGVLSAKPVSALNGYDLEFEDKDFEDRTVKGINGVGWDLNNEDSIVNEILAGNIEDLETNEILLTKRSLDAFGLTASEVLNKNVIINEGNGFFGLSSVKPLPSETYTVVGVVDYGDDGLFILSLEESILRQAEKNRYDGFNDYLDNVGYQSIYVATNEAASVKDIASEIRVLGYDAQTLEEALELFNTFFNIIPIIFTMIGSIAVFVGSIGIVNTMVMSVIERTKEIGVMKAVGAKNRNILALFITESALIGLIGGIFAVVISYILMLGIDRLLTEKVLPDLGIENISNIFLTSIELVLVALFFSTLIGILAGIYPALRAARLDPVKALRYE